MVLFSDQPRFFFLPFFLFFFFFLIGWRLKPRFFSVQSDFLEKWYFLSSHLVSIHCSCSILRKVSSDVLLLESSEYISCLCGSNSRMNFPWFQ